MLQFELLLVATALLTPVHSASRQSFCKCVCGSNSTIIPLDGRPLDPPTPRYRSSAISSLTSTTSSSSSASSSIDSLLPSDGKSRDRDGIYDPADQGYNITNYANDTSRHLDRHTQRHKRADPEDEPDEDADAITVADPLAHAQTAGLDQFGTSTATATTSSASSTASADETADESSPGNSTDTQLVSPQRAGTCADCNRQFCLEHPDFDKMCGEAKEEEVFTTCFQRDSAKDQLVVYTFIIVTVGLLGYAAVRPWIERKYEAVRERRTYAPVSGGQGNG